MNGFDLALLTTDPAPYVIMFTEQTIWQVLGHIITVLVLFFVLAKLLFKPVRNILENRKEEIASEYQRIEEDTEAVATLKTEYEDKLKNINKEADQILAHARKRAIEREDEIVKEAKEEADRLMKRAHLEVEREKEQIKDEMRREIIEVATVMASKFVAASISEEQKNTLVNETLTDMGDSTWLN